MLHYCNADYPAPSAFNDIFGFFIWTASGNHTNTALLPNTSNPVSISTVNALYNTYFIDNDYANPTKATELNGLTSLIKTADYYVTAGTTYHVKLAIADGQDPGIDSIVWIRAGSVRFNIKDCVGAWVPHTWGVSVGTCTGACEGGDGLLPEVYFIFVAAANGKYTGCLQRLLTSPCASADLCYHDPYATQSFDLCLSFKSAVLKILLHEAVTGHLCLHPAACNCYC
jgi:hypothetical protein